MMIPEPTEARRREWAREGRATVKLIDAFLKRKLGYKQYQPFDSRTTYDPLAERNLNNAKGAPDGA